MLCPVFPYFCAESLKVGLARTLSFVAAGTGDETVRLWRVFPAAKKLSALKHVSNEVRCRIR